MANLSDINQVGEYTDAINNIRELLGAIFIQEQRNYDMLSIIADKLGADAKGLFEMHELGKVLAPAPSFIFEDDKESASHSESEVV